MAIHNGRVVKGTGDGVIAEFRSVVEAVRCAREIQSGMVERNAGVDADTRIVFRIGVHLGDVVEESDGDLMGDGVNVAARLEGVCEPGGICLSEDAYRQVRDKIAETFVDMGEQTLKNIARPMRAYAVTGPSGGPPAIRPAGGVVTLSDRSERRAEMAAVAPAVVAILGSVARLIAAYADKATARARAVSASPAVAPNVDRKSRRRRFLRILDRRGRHLDRGDARLAHARVVRPAAFARPAARRAERQARRCDASVDRRHAVRQSDRRPRRRRFRRRPDRRSDDRPVASARQFRHRP